MSTTVQEALDGLKGLAEPKQLRQLAEEGLAPPRRPRVNSHIHLPPNFSAFESVAQAVDSAAEQEIGVLGVSNYYDFTVYGEFVQQAQAQQIFPLFGLEIISHLENLADAGTRINDPGNPGKIYICGKGITRFAEPAARAAELLKVIRDNDENRMREMTDRLAGIFSKAGVELDVSEDDIIDMIVARHGAPRDTVVIQERHIAQAFQEALFAKFPPYERASALAKVFGQAPSSDTDDAVEVQGEIRSRLMKADKPAFVRERFVDFSDAIRLILALGGIPCYPTLADGTDPICEFEATPAKLVDELADRNICCAEFIPIRNEPEVLSEYVTAMRRAGIVVTGGTEHNTLALLPIEPACVGGKPVPEQIKEIFWEGACVVAAHQFLTLHGECGYVDGEGRPNPAYDDTEQRIRAFRQLGAAMIARYMQQA